VSHTTDAQALLERLESAKPTNTEIRSIAQEQGKNHELATQLWKHGGFPSRMLSLLVLDLKAVDLKSPSLTSIGNQHKIWRECGGSGVRG
jgi:hypothetical protein